MLGDGEHRVREGQAEKDESEDVKSINCMHEAQRGTLAYAASSFLVSFAAGLWLFRGERGTVGDVQRAEPSCEMRVWVPQSLLAWVEKEAQRKALTRSAHVRSLLASIKERQERAA